MIFNISNEDKRTIIEQNISASERILYSELVFQGVDPESFSATFFDDKDSPEDLLKFGRLKEVYETYVNLQEMLNTI
jgi:hypothetical protein